MSAADSPADTAQIIPKTDSLPVVSYHSAETETAGLEPSIQYVVPPLNRPAASLLHNLLPLDGSSLHNKNAPFLQNRTGIVADTPYKPDKPEHPASFPALKEIAAQTSFLKTLRFAFRW